jgi:UDP-N-acetylglucosamine/UDP-N-acetylgalactosamine 4-epimerase
MISTKYDSIQLQLKNNPKTFAVTGAAGFIGSHLVEKLLLLDQKVVAIDNFATGYQKNYDLVHNIVGETAWKNFTSIEADVANLSQMKKAFTGVDYVLHQGALGSVPRSIDDPFASHTANVTGSVSVFEAARACGVKRVVFASSSSVYGDSEISPKQEDTIGHCLSPYAVTKRVDELYSEIFERCYQLPIIALRYFNVFGPRQDPNGAYAAVIPRWIDTLLRGETCIIYGDGSTSRDFCFIENVVQANILAATSETPKSRIFNVAMNGNTSLLELHKYLVELCAESGKNVQKQPEMLEFRQGDIHTSLANIDRIQDQLGYVPVVSVKDGLRKTLNSFF